MKKVLVIVVTYNGRRWLDRCLSSVAASVTADLQADLYVWDNDSTDGSADYVQAAFPSAKLIRSAENSGFSVPNDKGMEYSLQRGYDYVYLLNQDAWLTPGALEILLSTAEAHPEYAILSPLQMRDGYKALDPQFAKLLPPGTKTPESVRGWEDSGWEENGEVLEVHRVMAAHWLVPVRAINKIGLFNEELFPLYGQDDDWCNRARFHGMKIGIVPQAKGVHDRAQRTEAKEKLIGRNYYTGSLVRLADVNRPLWERFLFVCLFTLVKAVKYRSFLPFKYFRTICKQLPSVRKHRKESARMS